MYSHVVRRVDLADMGSTFVNDAKSILHSVGESIQDIDIQIPEMNIKLSDLVSDVLASARDKTQSINHIFNSTFPKREESTGTTASEQTEASTTQTVTMDANQEMHDLKQKIIEQEEEEEEIDYEALAKDAAMRMKHQDHQFILLCRKFASIRNTLMSIQHRVIPYIPSIVMIGPRHARQPIIESILGQPFAFTDAIYDNNTILEFHFNNNADLKEPKIQINGEETMMSVAEAEKFIQKLASTAADQATIHISVQGPDIPYLNLYDIPEESRALCEKYIGRNLYTVIMAVYDTSRLNTESVTTKLCEKYDPLGRRTVGILTKSATIDQEIPLEAEEELAESDSSVVSASSVVGNYRPPLSLGYIDMTHDTTDTEKEQRLLRHHLFGIIEQSMGRSIYNIADSIQSELEETSYLFKVIYNDHEMTAASYVTDTMDGLKRGFKQFATSLGKPQLRAEVRHLLEQNVLNVCAEQYWSDAKILELAKADADDFYWLYKMDLASAAITKSGIGRITTQLVMHVIMNNMQHLVKMEPFQYHPQVQKQIVDLTGEMLRQKFLATSDQVENTIKPYKYEVEVTDEEWKDGVRRTIKLLEKELNMCEDMLWTLKKNIGRKRLRSAIKRVLDEEKVHLAEQLEQEDGTEEQQPHRILEKAKEALFLQDRAMIIKYRLAALKSRQCKTPDNKQYCPEAFLNVIAEKLTYTAVMFIQVELLNDFFFNFPLDVIDDRIVHPMSMAQIDKFAKENPSVQKHLILQDRKTKLENVMDMLNYLVKRHDINPPSKY
ncbi:mitochondrial dynamin GTPase [Mucor ambiguus]|uniref:Mitochondrial dynamin GTPase n=1 Tax=Mucor ambiguus TaxID=91626 RepID=A0A0C9ME05_9FUNG|nr:mitochondrial dynamin GTPase [Mucor ambiguus]